MYEISLALCFPPQAWEECHLLAPTPLVAYAPNAHTRSCDNKIYLFLPWATGGDGKFSSSALPIFEHKRSLLCLHSSYVKVNRLHLYLSAEERVEVDPSE
jgi:hypothetical protein